MINTPTILKHYHQEQLPKNSIDLMAWPNGRYTFGVVRWWNSPGPRVELHAFQQQSPCNSTFSKNFSRMTWRFLLNFLMLVASYRFSNDPFEFDTTTLPLQSINYRI